MNCGFINQDYTMEYKELDKAEVEELCVNNKYFSINSNGEYMIFIDNMIYTVENMDKIVPLLIKINKELLTKELSKE